MILLLRLVFPSGHMTVTVAHMTRSDAPVTSRPAPGARLSRRDLAVVLDTRKHLADGSARLARTAAGIRVGEMASVLGVTPQAVSQWEHGHRTPDAAHALAYARALAAVAV